MKRGQLLAEIDTPEIDQQLQQARADLATAEANARAGADDRRALRGSDQDRLGVAPGPRQRDRQPTRRGRRRSLSAHANVKRLEQLQAFKTIYAPFDGVITARNTDIGALIGSGSGAKELFHIAAIDRLRVFVNVPQVYSRAARPGLEATSTLQELPGRTLQGHARADGAGDRRDVAHAAGEIDVDNPSGELLPGSYARCT